MQALLRRRFPAESRHGVIVHEVQIAHADERWIARIVTLPDTVWRDRTRSSPLVFAATTREEVEGKAFSCLLRECGQRGERVVGLNHDACIGLDGAPARRIIAMYPVQFNLRPGRNVIGSRAIESSFTANLSETGLFIVTGRDLAGGATLDIRLTLVGRIERMEGQVMWRRDRGEDGRPPGVGVVLADPPLSYRTSLLSHK